MRIIFFGEDSFSAKVVESLVADYEVLAVFCPKYLNTIHTRLELTSTKNNIPFYRINNINSAKNFALIKKLKPDLIIVCHFEKVLKNNIIEIPIYGSINLHPSLLPNYRGLSPQHWPIINGDKETGITIHYINEGIDTGDIILQQKISIEPDMKVVGLQLKMLRYYPILIKEAVKLIDQGKVNPIRQIPSQGSYYGKLRRAQCEIDINNGYLEAYNLIRGVSKPYFGASYKNYIIWEAHIPSYSISKMLNKNYMSNGIFIDNLQGALIKFNDGCLLLDKYHKV